MVFRNNDLPGVMLASAAQRADAAVGRAPRQPRRRGDGERLRATAPPSTCSMPASRWPRCCDLRPPRRLVGECYRDELDQRGVRVRDGWTVSEAVPGRAGPRLEAAMLTPCRREPRSPVGSMRPDRDLRRARSARPARLPCRRAPRLRRPARLLRGRGASRAMFGSPAGSITALAWERPNGTACAPAMVPLGRWV